MNGRLSINHQYTMYRLSIDYIKGMKRIYVIEGIGRAAWPPASPHGRPAAWPGGRAGGPAYILYTVHIHCIVYG